MVTGSRSYFVSEPPSSAVEQRGFAGSVFSGSDPCPSRVAVGVVLWLFLCPRKGSSTRSRVLVSKPLPRAEALHPPYRLWLAASPSRGGVCGCCLTPTRLRGASPPPGSAAAGGAAGPRTPSAPAASRRPWESRRALHSGAWSPGVSVKHEVPQEGIALPPARKSSVSDADVHGGRSGWRAPAPPCPGDRSGPGSLLQHGRDRNAKGLKRNEGGWASAVSSGFVFPPRFSWFRHRGGIRQDTSVSGRWGGSVKPGCRRCSVPAGTESLPGCAAGVSAPAWVGGGWGGTAGAAAAPGAVAQYNPSPRGGSRRGRVRGGVVPRSPSTPGAVRLPAAPAAEHHGTAPLHLLVLVRKKAEITGKRKIPGRRRCLEQWKSSPLALSFQRCK